MRNLIDAYQRRHVDTVRHCAECQSIHAHAVAATMTNTTS
jgi:hypothetical protein